MDAIIVDLIDVSKQKADLIKKELAGHYDKPSVIDDAIYGAVVTGVKLALDELQKRDKIKWQKSKG